MNITEAEKRFILSAIKAEKSKAGLSKLTMLFGLEQKLKDLKQAQTEAQYQAKMILDDIEYGYDLGMIKNKILKNSYLDISEQQAQTPPEVNAVIKDFLRVYVFTVDDDGHPTAPIEEIMELIQRAQKVLQPALGI